MAYAGVSYTVGSSGGPAGGGATTRFTPADFKYNGRVALALIPCLLTVAVVGGATVLACLTVGAMIVYLMDALQYREGTFTCAWLTLIAANVTFGISLMGESDAPVLLQISMLFGTIFLSALTGMWASLQFKWIQMQYPAVAIYFERCVLTASLPLAAVMHSLGLATFVPYSDVPYYLALILAGLYYALGRPLMSSFYNVKAGPAAMGGGPAVGPEAVVQTRGDGALMALLVAALPAATYAAIHWVVLGFGLHVYSMLLLAGGMPLVLALLPGGMWWLAPTPVAPVNAARSGPAGMTPSPSTSALTGANPTKGLAGFLRRSIIVLGLLVALVGFEGRVVFQGFGQYIKLPAPWNWVAVTFALFGCAGVGLMHVTGALGSTVDVTVAGSLLLLCTTAGSLAAGVPFHWLPAPLLAACGLSLFYDTHSLREYLVFVVGAFLTCLWFMRQHFWFLDVLVSGVHLHTVCKLVVAALVPALSVPGLLVARANAHLVGALLVLQAGLICFVEEALFVEGHSDDAPEPMYPGWLVVATSLLGLAAARLLTGRARLTPLASWLLHSAYLAKLSILVLPEARLVLPSSLLLAATLAPYFFHGASWMHNTPYGRAGALLAVAATPPPLSADPSTLGPSAPARPRRLRLAPWQGLLHVLTIFIAVLLARFAVFDVVQFLISARPAEGLLLGSLVLTLAAALFPLATHCYGGSGLVTRVAVATALVGGLLVMLQPPLPIAGGARCPRLPLSLCPRLWDERHVPMHSVEDVEVWGRGLSRRQHWPRWLLIAAVVVGMATTGGAGPGGPLGLAAAGPQRRPGVLSRVLLGSGAGLLVGGYTSLELLPEQVPLQILVTGASVVAVLFVVLMSLPRAGGPVALPALAVLWGVLSGLALLLHAELPVPQGMVNVRLFPDSKVQVLDEIHRATKASLLAIVASHALLMAFALKLKMSSALSRRAAAARDTANGSHPGQAGPSHGTYSYAVTPNDLLCGLVPPRLMANYACMLKLEGAGGMALQRLAAEGLAWVPTLGNLLTMSAVALGVALNGFLTGGSPEAIFMLAPILLLLAQDPLLFPGLSDRQRYCPPAAAVSAFLLATGAAVAVSDVATGRGDAARSGLPGWMYLAKEIGMALAAAPHHFLFLQYLWTHRAKSWGLALLLCSPVCLVPALLCDVPALRYFGAVGAVAAVLQYFSMKHIRHVGMRVI